MVMSAKTQFWIAVIGLSGRENGESFQGPGKSCLCDRFMSPDKDPSTGHTSIISQQDFHGPIINTDHFLYWGRTRRTVDGKMVEFNIIEQTEFLDDVSFTSFNARDPYIKRATSATINSSRKIQYLSPEQLQDPRSCKAQKFAARKLHIDGFLCVYDVSKVSDRAAGTQYKFVFELLDLIDVPVVLVATKCDKGRSRHFEEMMYLAKVQKVPIVETSALENVNVSQAFFSLVRIFNRQVIVSKKHIQYFNPKDANRKQKSYNKKEKKPDKKEKVKKPPKPVPEKIICSPPTTKRNGSVNSKNDSETSVEWPAEAPTNSNHNSEPSLIPSPRDSPIPDSLVRPPLPVSEPPYEHINGDDHIALYENCNIDHIPEDELSRGTSQSQHDSVSRDSQLSKSDSLQSKTSSDEYIPVPRAPYDPSENYENVTRYHHGNCPNNNNIANNCPSPTTNSSDSERGFLTGIPEHMKSFTSQRPWEIQWTTYTNVTVDAAPPIHPRSRQQSDHTSSGSHSTSSIDTDSQANLHFGRQLAVTNKKYFNSVSSYSNGTPDRSIQSSCSMKSECRSSCSEQYVNVNIPRCEVDLPEEELEDLPPYPALAPGDDVIPADPRYCLNKDLDEMNTLVGEISNLVWQNEPLPPPPPESDFLTPNSEEPIPDFEKTPTNEPMSPNPYVNTNIEDKNTFTYPINEMFDKTVAITEVDCAIAYENVQPSDKPQPGIPPRQPCLPPRTDIPQRITISEAEKWTPAIPPRDNSVPPRVIGQPPAREITPRDAAAARGLPVPPRAPTTAIHGPGAVPPKEYNHNSLLPPRIPHPRHFKHHTNHNNSENDRPPNLPAPNLPPRNGNADIPPRNHMPNRVPLPPRHHNVPPVYSEVEKRNNKFVPRTKCNNNVFQHDFSPYVIPGTPKVDRWEEYTNCIDNKKSVKKKTKVKLPQR